MNAPITMADVIVPKSDQLNADDFISGPATFTIREVQLRGGQEQPVNILLDSTDKAYRPCKSMCRVLVNAWGPDAKAYVGRSLTLYRDPTVKWGGLEVGGIRISHMSDIEGKMQMQLTATRGQRKPYIVMPLVMPPPAPNSNRAKAEAWLAQYESDLRAAPDLDAFMAVQTKAEKALAKLFHEHPDLYARALNLGTELAPAEEQEADLLREQEGA